MIEVIVKREGMTAEEEVDYLLGEIDHVMQQVIDLCSIVKDWYDHINGRGEQVKAVAKSLQDVKKSLIGREVRKGVIRGILEGDVTTTSDWFKKDGSVLSKFRKELERIMYV